VARPSRVLTEDVFPVRQTERWRGRHRVFPFPRRFDDQFARAARIREPGPAAPPRSTASASAR